MLGLLGTLASQALPILASFAAKKLAHSPIGSKIKQVIGMPTVRKNSKIFAKAFNNPSYQIEPAQQQPTQNEAWQQQYGQQVVQQPPIRRRPQQKRKMIAKKRK